MFLSCPILTIPWGETGRPVVLGTPQAPCSEWVAKVLRFLLSLQLAFQLFHFVLPAATLFNTPQEAKQANKMVQRLLLGYRSVSWILRFQGIPWKFWCTVGKHHRTEIKDTDSRVRWPKSKDIWPWTNDLIFLGVGFFICKIEKTD